MQKILYFLSGFCLLFSSARAQTPTEFPSIAIGQWSQHLPWQRAFYVTQSESKVYFATEWAIVEIDKADRSPHFLTKVDGLSDAGMGIIRFNKNANLLLVTYANSNIDIWNPADGAVFNMPFIVKNLNLTGDKQIYGVTFVENHAYLACGFGLVKLDLLEAEVTYTTFTDVPVRSVAEYDGFLYAGTDEGMYRIPANDINPEDFGRWTLLDASQGFPAGEAVTAMAVAFGELYIGIGKTLYNYNGVALNALETSDAQEVFYLTNEGAGLVIGWKKDFDGRVKYREAGGAMYDIHWACQAGKPLDAVEDGQKKFWFADNSDEFRFFDANIDQCDRFHFNSPYYQTSTEIAINNNTVYIGTPGYDISLAPIYGRNGVYIYKDGLWERFSIESNPELADDTANCHVDLWRVAPHPDGDTFYAGSFVGGLVEATAPGEPTKLYRQKNSILQGAGASGSGRTAIGGIAFDEDKNLWISNYDADAPIAVLKADGTLRNFSAAPANNLLQVAVDHNGYKWFVIGFSGGVLVYDSGNDIDSPSDDRYRWLTTANSVLPTNTINCLAVDLEGDVWIGTQQGTISFECGSNIFDPECKGSRRVATVDDFGAYLLANQEITSIAVDGANQKWFGTLNGIFVQSASGETPVAQFTETNSPLFDNLITDIAIDPETGEVWIGTDKGVISYRSEATEGGRINSQMPYAYPNPVRPGYTGPIAIYGLARDANVKITDIAGNLVYEGKALGGQAIWDGRDYLGRRAASGVYLILATSDEAFESPDAVVAKVVILN